MCGIVLAGRSYGLNANESSLFETLLFMDTIRGVHATGIIAGYNISPETYSVIAKAALPAPLFLGTDEYDSVKSQSYKTTYGTTLSKTPYYMVGHNRHATRGAKTAENAHPFVCDDITLVHNGTLTVQSHLPDHTKFEVDSKNICHSINKIGAAETIQKLEGAFTLIWHNQKEHTLNIIRNEERPFHLALTTTGTWFGASEEDMLMWVLKRDDKHSFSKSSPTISKHFECEVGTQYVFDVSDGKFVLKEEIKHTLPKFERKYESSSYDWSKYYRQESSRYSPTYATKSANDHLKEAGVDAIVGSRLKFEALEFHPYYSNRNIGRISGWIPGIDMFVQVESHANKVETYQENTMFDGEVVSAYLFNQILTVIVKDIKEVTETPNLPAVIEPDVDVGDYFDEAPDLVVMEDSETFTKKEWEESERSTCAMCNTQITFEEAEEAFVIEGNYLHCGCYYEMLANLDIEEGQQTSSVEEDAPFHDSPFHCTACGMRKFPSQESDTHGVCKDCSEHFYSYENNVKAAVETKLLDDGSRVTRDDWNKINECLICGNQIPFEKASDSTVRCNGVLCEDCWLS